MVLEHPIPNGSTFRKWIKQNNIVKGLGLAHEKGAQHVSMC